LVVARSPNDADQYSLAAQSSIAADAQKCARNDQHRREYNGFNISPAASALPEEAMARPSH
jgi:hypothetical protein